MASDRLVQLTQIRALARSGATRELRLALDLTLPEIASHVGVSPSTIYRWEIGERSPRGDAALRYRAAIRKLVRERFPELEQVAS